MIDKRLCKGIAVFAACIAALFPLYLFIGLANLHFGWRISYDIACFVLLVIAVSVVGNIYTGKKSKDATPP